MSLPAIQVGPVALTSTSLLRWSSKYFERFPTHPLLTTTDHWTIRQTDLRPIPQEPLLFDSGGSWKAYGREGHFFLGQYSLDREVADSVLEIEESTKSLVYFASPNKRMTHPLDELFFIYAFSLTNSLFVHGCFVDWNGEGILFCGVSGAGKSTIGKLLQKEPGVNVHCDERNVITFREEGIVVSSSPWPGSAGISKLGAAPLKALVFLNSGHEGFSFVPAQGPEGLSQLMQTIFLPLFSVSGIERTLATVDKVLSTVPTFLLNYDKSKVDIGERLSAVFSQGNGSMASLLGGGIDPGLRL